MMQVLDRIRAVGASGLIADREAMEPYTWSGTGKTRRDSPLQVPLELTDAKD